MSRWFFLRSSLLKGSLLAFSRAASVAFLPSALFCERFSLGASWAYSFQQVLLPDTEISAALHHTADL